MINSKRKGKIAELAFVNLCKQHGYDARRGQQYSGIGGEDVVGLDGIHVEVKHNQTLNIHDAMEQSSSEAGDKIPIVAHKKNHKSWLITMYADDWFRLYKHFYVVRQKILKGVSVEDEKKANNKDAGVPELQ